MHFIFPFFFRRRCHFFKKHKCLFKSIKDGQFSRNFFSDQPVGMVPEYLEAHATFANQLSVIPVT